MTSDFAQHIYNLLDRVPAGRVTTYKALAEAVGTKAYRAVGQVLNRNPNAPEVPCHRVVASDGALGGYAFGVEKKKDLLLKEGVGITDGKVAEQFILRSL